VPTFEELFPIAHLRRGSGTPFATARHIVGLIAVAMSLPAVHQVRALRLIPAYWSRGKSKAHKKPFQRTVLSADYAGRSKYKPSYDGPRRAELRFG
jgi:hypothetical protein